MLRAGDHDAFRGPGRARRIDHVGRVVGAAAGRPRSDRRLIGRVDQRRGRHGRTGQGRAVLRREDVVGDNQEGRGVGEADRDAVGRRVRVERQPGGPGLGDGDLRDQEVEAPLHPQARYLAGPQTSAQQSARQSGGRSVDFRVCQAPGRRHQGRPLAARQDRRGEDLRQGLVAQEVWPVASAQDRRRKRGWIRCVLDSGIPLPNRCVRLTHRFARPSPAGPGHDPTPPHLSHP